MVESAPIKINAECCAAEAARVGAAVACLLDRPAKVDFYSVAAESGVSRSTLYRNPELRSVVESARASRPDHWEPIGRLAAENIRLRAWFIALTTRDVCDLMIDYDGGAIPLVA